MRGDRPPASTLTGSRSAATPHARGSTFGGDLVGVRLDGYPACAGIDLILTRMKDYDGRLPRMRGDRPWAVMALEPHTMATPHARGSTHDQLRLLPDHGGYPACAGIDLYRWQNIP